MRAALRFLLPTVGRGPERFASSLARGNERQSRVVFHSAVNFAVAELLIITVVLGLNVLWIAALVSAANYDSDVWIRAGRDKQSWILALIFFSGIAAAAYMLRARPALRRAALE